jgi:hypothetical protein
MATDWDDMSHHEKLETLRRDMIRIVTALNALTSDVDRTWTSMRETSSEMRKVTKDVATLRALWPYTKKYSQTG